MIDRVDQGSYIEGVYGIIKVDLNNNGKKINHELRVQSTEVHLYI